MHVPVHLRLCGVLVGLGLSLPLLALPAHRDHTQTVGQRREAVLFWSQAKRDADFSRMYRLFPADRVAHGAHVHALPVGKPLTPVWKDPSITLASYMRKYHVAGVMVLQDGRVRLARYAANFGPHKRWTSFSVAKSVTSVLLGIALKQGDVRSLDDQVTAYIPQLQGSAYDGVTVRDLLTMTSGVRWNENYTDPDSDVAQMYLHPCIDHESHVVTYLKGQPRQWPPGTHFNYNTAQIDLLGVLVQRATHQSLASYLATNIWKPYGMASAAFWIKDECSGGDTGGSGLSATLADYARFGQFMLDGGRIDGRQIIARTWLAGALQRDRKFGKTARGYGYLWWTDATGDYAAVGIFGQLVYVDPSRDLVIVQVAAWPKPYSKDEVAARRAFVAAVKRAADGAPPLTEHPPQRAADGAPTLTEHSPQRAADGAPTLTEHSPRGQ